jgi:cation/acetate symporter
MSSEVYERIRLNPKFQELVTTRGRLAWTLSICVLVLFYGFVLAVAYLPATLGQAVSKGSMLTVGVAIELFLFVFMWLLSAYYVKRANGEFDALTQEVIKQAWKEEK